MAWSSLAHLPTTEDEYFYILSHLKNGMCNQEVDAIIAFYKRKYKVQHHYRSNLARIGLFNIKNNRITLNYDVERLSKSEDYLKLILRRVVIDNQTFEMKEVADTIKKMQSYNLQTIVDVLEIKFPLVGRNNLIRWIRPIITLMKIADILYIKQEQKTSYTRYLQEAFTKTHTEFGKPVPFELVEIELKKIDVSLSIVKILDKVLEDFNIRFKIELLMMPSWATKNKSYKIGEDMYTHIKIKSNLLQED